MSFSVGIVGLPNVGKSTLFKALTKNPVDIADYPFTTIKPNIGAVAVPDERLKKIAEIIKPQKITPTIIEFKDIAGLVKGAHKGEGLGNQFLAQIRECDAIIEVVKFFGNNINPEQDIEIIKTEFEMKDKESAEKENLLSQKPIIYVFNIDGKQKCLTSEVKHLEMDLKLEEEISELSKEEAKEMEMKSEIDEIILKCYDILGLLTFYTITGGKETRAWTIKNGSTVIKAGGRVHSDFEEKFIKAEVADWQDLAKERGWSKAREQGLIKTVGKDYIVKDGDVIEFKI
jgi:ribosome-binding ATPase YchF (GTP1/OBG family)